MKYFGTSGIRGIANNDQFPDFYLHIALTVGTILKSKDVALASDGRITMPILKGAVVSGLAATGHNVIDLGTLPVSGLQYYCKVHKIPGLMVTASHNPSEYNGIKFFMENGMDFNLEMQEKVEQIYDSSKYMEKKGEGNAAESGINYVDWKSVGSWTHDDTAKELYIKGVLSHVDVEAIRAAKLTVLCDCTNGATSETTPMLLKELGITATVINGTLDGMFPGHQPEPIEENIGSTIELTKRSKIDFAIVHDSDGDRAIYITPDGRYLDGNYALSLIGLGKIKKGDKVVVPVNTSDIFLDTLQRLGGVADITKIGAPLVARRMVEIGSTFGGEENGGVIFGAHQFCRDGAMSVALMAEVVAKNNLGHLLASLPGFYYRRDKVYTPVPFDRIKARVMEQEHVSQDETDGIKIYFSERKWVLVRPSGTEPAVRVYAQGANKQEVDDLLTFYKKLALQE
ncbi:MAG TPA: phosphoglucosamine mutase [Candidatus Acidoferrales bacterium]|nr:phosphoglucosamine mutase [Candidatus Acidoferrales bacterium]